MRADWRTGWGPDWLTGWLTNLPTEGLTGLPGWLTTCQGAKLSHMFSSTPHFSWGTLPRPLRSVYSVEPSRGSAAPLHLHTRARNASPTAAINQQQRLSLSLSLSLASPFFSRSSTPTDMLDEAILKELTDVGWFAPGLSDIARVMYLMWSLFSSNKRIKN